MPPDPHDRSVLRELEGLRSELARERRRVRTLQIEASILRTGLAAVKGDIERIARSRAWRWGHGVALLASRLRRRRLRTAGAVERALERIQQLERALGMPLEGAPEHQPTLPPGHERRQPQLADASDLAAEIRRRLGPPSAAAPEALVSIVVVTRDGLDLVRRLVAGLLGATDYARMELVVVDNGSSDGTAEWLGAVELPFRLRVVANTDNRSFSDANNQGAAAAEGDLILFLNNDVEPFESGWLRELVNALRDGVGAVGALLVHANVTDPHAAGGWILQHRAIRFRGGAGGLQAHNAGDGEDVFGPGFGVETAVPAATAACLLVRREALDAVGGFPEGYRYGSEDVDLGLRLLREGWEIRCTGRSVVLHDESSTQSRQGLPAARLNRLANHRRFAERWAPQLRREVRLDRLAGRRLWSEEPPTVALTVTSLDPADGWGDWFTAHELGEALAKRGWRVVYAERRGDHWYDLPPEVDYIVALLDAFDARRIAPGIVVAAWIRNWTERWLERPWLDRVDLLLTSSRRSAELVEQATGRPTIAFPLATNPARFNPRSPGSAPSHDYVFTGNRWGEERALEQALRPLRGERVGLYGQGWKRVARLARHARGQARYDDLAAIYAHAKLVVDDTATPTLRYGAVNARVFDALACGTPVVTNCADGVRELFDDEFPVWDSRESLRAQLDHLLGDAERRGTLARRYRTEVVNRHTYAHRAQRLADVFQDAEQGLSFCLKIGAPDWEIAQRWGDLHFAAALRRELQRRGHRSNLQILPEWEDADGLECDVAIVLRGLSSHRPKPGQLNVLWSISHPDALTGTECDAYDLVCVASAAFADRVRTMTQTPVVVLEQATDPRIFYPSPSPDHRHELVFVGNSRNVRRKALDDVLPTERDLAIIGSNWDGLVDPRLVIAEHVPNDELRHVYSSASIVLNDHWEDMRTHGFVSNRVYDAVACGAVVVSDRVEGIEDRFGGAVIAYESREELHELVEHLLARPEERAARGAAGRERVLAAHTFAHRVDDLLAAVGDRISATGHPTRIVTPP